MSNGNFFVHSMKITHVAIFSLFMGLCFSTYSTPPSDKGALERGYCRSLGSQWGFELSLIPGNDELGTQDFCAFTYEAKAWKDLAFGNYYVDKEEIQPNGCDGKGSFCEGGSYYWGLDGHVPASVSEGNPWRLISRDSAIAECRQLNKYLSIPEDSKMKFDLISNSQWQTVAFNISSDKRNWTGEKVESGCLSQGNNGGAGCGYDGANPEKGDKEEARHFLSGSDDLIFHISGNVLEWVKNGNHSPQGKDQYMSDYSASDNPSIYYAPPKYSSCATKDCGYGYGWLNSFAGAVLRGGRWDDYNFAGVFAANLTHDSSFSRSDIGFRCVFSPPTDSENDDPDYE